VGNHFIFYQILLTNNFIRAIIMTKPISESDKTEMGLNEVIKL